MKFIFLLAIFLSSVAFCDDTNSNQIFEAKVTPSEQRTLIMVMPDMADKMIGAVDFHGNLPGSDNAELGVRAQIMVLKTKNMAVTIEGIAEGHTLGGTGIFDLADAYGGGARIELPLISDGKSNAMMISPGVDFMYIRKGLNNGGWFSGVKPYTDVYMIGTDVDVSYLHMFFKHFGIQVGLSAGLDFSLGGIDGLHQETKGKVYKRWGLFGGFVF